jgi:hypothetical protein
VFVLTYLIITWWQIALSALTLPTLPYPSKITKVFPKMMVFWSLRELSGPAVIWKPKLPPQSPSAPDSESVSDAKPSAGVKDHDGAARGTADVDNEVERR